ncbi:MAG: hypothetical protein ACPG73_04590 [Candidatus Poseidoniaceae archaeon]
MSRPLPVPNQSLIDEVQILPRKGMLYQLQGPGHSGKSMREFAEAWTAMTLMNGDYVHWIDGACRFNPARIIQTFPHTLPDCEQLLHGLFVGRGFTVHQFSHLVQRLQAEIKITKAKLIVVDGPITMHLDSQIGNYEARSLFRKTIDLLKKIADENDVGIVLITSSKAYSKRHSNLLTMVKNRCQASLLGKKRRIHGQNKMWLLHMPTKSSGYRKEITPQQTLYDSVSRVIATRLRIESIEEIE